MMDTDFFILLYTHLEEREFYNVCQSLKQDEEYLEASKEEAELCSRFEISTEKSEVFQDFFKPKNTSDTVF